MTIPMPVQVVFTFFGKKLDCASIPLSGLQGVAHRKIITLSIKHTRFAPELLGRMRVGI